jgi:hypothetical protein
VSIIFRLGASCSACSLGVRTLAGSFIAPVNELIVQVVGIVFAREVPVAFHRPFHRRLDLGDLPEGASGFSNPDKIETASPACRLSDTT